MNAGTFIADIGWVTEMDGGREIGGGTGRGGGRSTTAAAAARSSVVGVPNETVCIDPNWRGGGSGAVMSGN